MLRGLLITSLSNPFTFSSREKHQLHLPPQAMILTYFSQYELTLKKCRIMHVNFYKAPRQTIEFFFFEPASCYVELALQTRLDLWIKCIYHHVYLETQFNKTCVVS